jgi:F-type H+-transporting ATPase subunit b
LVVPSSFVKQITRGAATGDNSQVYIPSDAGFKEFQYSDEIFFLPPQSPGIKEVVVDTIDETQWNESLEDQMEVKFGKNMPTINDEKNPERDVVNFPRVKRPTYPEGHRLIIFPDSWFRAMYNKTGVTGPYALVGGLTTFLLSKEWLVIEHEMVTGFSLFIIFTYILKKWGELGNRYFEGMIDYEDFMWNKWQKDCIDVLEQLKIHELEVQNSLKNQDILFDAKKENVHLQREAEYRRRLMEVYGELKKKLDYQIASQNEEKAFAQRHMVKWILSAVEKGVFQTNEKEILSKCVSDLKALSQARAGVI